MYNYDYIIISQYINSHQTLHPKSLHTYTCCITHYSLLTLIFIPCYHVHSLTYLAGVRSMLISQNGLQCIHQAKSTDIEGGVGEVY